MKRGERNKLQGESRRALAGPGARRRGRALGGAGRSEATVGRSAGVAPRGGGRRERTRAGPSEALWCEKQKARGVEGAAHAVAFFQGSAGSVTFGRAGSLERSAAKSGTLTLCGRGAGHTNGGKCFLGSMRMHAIELHCAASLMNWRGSMRMHAIELGCAAAGLRARLGAGGRQRPGAPLRQRWEARPSGRGLCKRCWHATQVQWQRQLAASVATCSG